MKNNVCSAEFTQSQDNQSLIFHIYYHARQEIVGKCHIVMYACKMYVCVCVCVFVCILHIGNIWIYYHVRRETKKVALHCYTRVKMKAYTQAHIALESPVFPVTFRHLRMFN